MKANMITNDETKTKATEIEAMLDQCTGTNELYRHFTGMLYTDGLDVLANMAESFWLIDLIASYQTRKLDAACGGFQIWELTVNLDKQTAVLTVKRDSNEPALVTKRIDYTDFPLASIKFYVEGEGRNKTLMLPSER